MLTNPKEGRIPFAYLLKRKTAAAPAKTAAKVEAAKPKPKVAVRPRTDTPPSEPVRFAHLVPISRNHDDAPREPAPEAKTIDTAYAEAARILAAGAYSRGETPPTMTAPTIRREMSLAVSDPKALAERILAAGRGDAGR